MRRSANATSSTIPPRSTPTRPTRSAAATRRTSWCVRPTPRRWRRWRASVRQHRVPLVVRGAGTGYTGGAVPVRGGVVLSVERLNRILEIDEVNLTVVVEPAVITGDLQRAVEARGLYYPPDPGEPRVVVDWRQRRGVRRRTARVQVRHDQALRAGARGGAPDRRDHPHRIEGGEERRRLRPDAAAGRVRGHARHHHAHHAAAAAVSAGPRHGVSRVRRHPRGGRWGDRAGASRA